MTQDNENELRREEILSGIDKFIEHLKKSKKKAIAEEVRQKATLQIDGWLNKSNGEITTELNEIADSIKVTKAGSKTSMKSILEKLKSNALFDKISRVFSVLFDLLKDNVVTIIVAISFYLIVGAYFFGFRLVDIQNLIGLSFSKLDLISSAGFISFIISLLHVELIALSIIIGLKTKDVLNQGKDNRSIVSDFIGFTLFFGLSGIIASVLDVIIWLISAFKTELIFIFNLYLIIPFILLLPFCFILLMIYWGHSPEKPEKNPEPEIYQGYGGSQWHETSENKWDFTNLRMYSPQWNKKRKQYIRSPEWNIIRKQKLREANYQCQRCSITGKPLEAHHLNYDNLGHELMSDLIAVCRKCHLELELEKEN